VKSVVVVVAAVFALSAQGSPPAQTCRPVGRPQLLPAVPEASGIAEAAGAWWTHNDTDGPVLFRLDGSGQATPVTVSGATAGDWEDLAAAGCPTAVGDRCLYIADIGDNRGSRQRITIYTVPIPKAGSTTTERATAYHATYPDYPHDAEALLVISGSALKLSPTPPTILIVTKEVPTQIYAFIASQNPGETGTLKLFRTLKDKVRITGGAVSPDERWVALRSNTTLLLYTLDGFAKGAEPIRVDLRGLKEPQGEGVAFGRGGEIYLVSEGGGKRAPGLVTRIQCVLP
jgi:hypothetical protein